MPTTVNGTDLDDLIDFSFIDTAGNSVSGADDFVFAGAGDDTIISGAGGDVIIAGVGNDTVLSGDGNDQVLGGTGNDTVRAGNGSDLVFGGDGDDTLYGERGNDRLFGGAGDDYLHGGHGNDYLSGGDGNDFILGIKGHNFISGGAGNDYISTGDHTSTVDGGADDDWINVRMKKGADHTLTGGTGADTFEFIQTASRRISDIVITDFELGVDNFIIEGENDFNYLLGGLFGIDEVIEEPSYFLSETEVGTVLELETGDSITFSGVSLEAFSNYYFEEFVFFV